MRRSLIASCLFFACTGASTQEPPSEKVEPTSAPLPAVDEASISGVWRAVLDSPGGPLPFTLSIMDRGGQLETTIRNGTERILIPKTSRLGEQVRFEIEGYDSAIVATLEDSGRQMRGTWGKTIPEGRSELPFSAAKGDNRRFLPELDSTLTPQAGSPEKIDGNWNLAFTEEDGSTFVGRAELKQEGEELSGTILTDTGDYRFLAGSYHSGWLLLSVFDGGHAFLFEARLGSDGKMQGDFWSRDSYHATFAGERLEKGKRDELANPWKIVTFTQRSRRLSFAFPDLEGQTVSSGDARFEDKVVLVDIFGTWCPNCNDQAPILAGWDKKYRERGLEIVGLAYEMTGDEERDRVFVGKYKERYGIEFPLLLAGVSDKAKASETLPGLSKVAAYPTSVFIGRDGTIRKIYSGFSGPATGRHHERMMKSHEATIEKLLVEGQPSSDAPEAAPNATDPA